MALAVEGDIGGLCEVEIIAIPQAGLREAPLSGHRAAHPVIHGGTFNDLGSRRPWGEMTSSTLRYRSACRPPKNGLG